MTGFLGRLFGKKSEEKPGSATQVIEDVLKGLFASANFQLSFEVERNEDKVNVEIFGEDEELLRAKEGQLLDAIQLFLTRVVQHQLKDERVTISVDNSGYREESNQELIDLAEKLKNIALEKGKPVYFRALPPRDRKVIHQHLAADGRVKSRSVGDGLYKKIKIYPLKGDSNLETAAEIETV
jgi:spoIIIJ-associated protein